MCDRPWETMTDADFEAMLAQSVPDTPPEEIVAEVTPWRRAMNRILFGMALCAITLNFLCLNYILPAVPGCDRDPFVYSDGSDLVYFFIGSERRGFQQRHGERAEQHCGEQQRERLFELHFVFPPRFLFPISFSSIVSISQRLKRMQYEKL